MTEKVMGNTGAQIKAQAMMYKVVVQAVLLYGSGIWVTTDVTMPVLEGFHNRISIQIAEMTSSKEDSGEWEWASLDAALEVTCLWPIR